MPTRPTIIAVLLLLLLSCEADRIAWADEVPVPRPKTNASPAEGEFAKLFSKWKHLLADLELARGKFPFAEEESRPQLEQQYNALRDETAAMIPALAAAAEKQYQAAPEENDDLAIFLFGIMADRMSREQYESATPLIRLLLDSGFDKKTFGKFPGVHVHRLAGLTAYAMADWEKAKEHLAIANKAGVLVNDAKAREFFAVLHDDAVREAFVKDWQKEQEIRAAEAKVVDPSKMLPRVRFSTSQGDIDIELFENEAPNTVANFISLVEKGFYDGLKFHRVLDRFMAQGGCPNGTGKGGPGYQIKCECYEPNARKHFRGSLSMAHSGVNSGGSQFFLTFLPTRHLNGKHTVFGRVIKGFDALAKLRYTEIDGKPNKGMVPDQIIKATVLRKRPHEYAPKILSPR
jgi:cyclophilin family peptidyl-prolyl cis-trans isomerase